jgi:hypothetical protein
MPIENRSLKLGTKLVGRYHKQSYTCEVVEGEGGRLRYRLADGREFKSPSAAGMAITGHACDGWVFWSVATAEASPTPDVEQKEPPTEPTTESAPNAEMPANMDVGTMEPETSPVIAPTAEEPAPAKKRIFRLPNQKGVPEGNVRWYCHDCGKSFLTELGETPQFCPQGHEAA